MKDFFSFRFGISKDGVHAGVIIFSDKTYGTNAYTKMTIKLNDFYNTTSFNDAVGKSPYFGFKTRMDLAFKVAEEELFTLAGGMCM